MKLHYQKSKNCLFYFSFIVYLFISLYQFLNKNQVDKSVRVLFQYGLVKLGAHLECGTL